MCRSGCIVLPGLLILTFCLQIYPAAAIAVTRECSACHRCISYDMNGNCNECGEYDERYCNLIEIEVIDQGCEYFKALYRYTLKEYACPVADGMYENYIEPACSDYDLNYRECYNWLTQHSSVFFAAICDWPSDLQSAIYAAGIPDCLATDAFGDGSPLPPSECQEFLDWCEAEMGRNADIKCAEYGFTGTAYDNCISVCESMIGYSLETVVSDPMSDGVCMSCGGGEYYYYDSMSESCQPCGAGTYQTKKRHLETSCMSCLDGYYNGNIGASKCTECPLYSGNANNVHSSGNRNSIDTCYIDKTVEQTDNIGTFIHAGNCGYSLTK